MSCADTELLMADAWGGELSEADRPVFEAHLATCARCRREYRSGLAAVATMRTLPGPEPVTVQREGDRLVIYGGSPRRSAPWGRGVLRYAAGLLIAFVAGYGFHGGLPAMDAGRSVDEAQPAIRAVGESTSGGSLEGALVRTHARRPSRSGLAKCLIAMSAARR